MLTHALSRHGGALRGCRDTGLSFHGTPACSNSKTTVCLAPSSLLLIFFFWTLEDKGFYWTAGQDPLKATASIN